MRRPCRPISIFSQLSTLNPQLAPPALADGEVVLLSVFRRQVSPATGGMAAKGFLNAVLVTQSPSRFPIGNFIERLGVGGVLIPFREQFSGHPVEHGIGYRSVTWTSLTLKPSVRRSVWPGSG